MAEDISMQILSQTSENIQKLFDLSTRIDERLKAFQAKQEGVDAKVEETAKIVGQIQQEIAVLKSKDTTMLITKLQLIEQQQLTMDKEMSSLKSTSGQNQDRWNKIIAFGVQLIWVLLAAWLLWKFNLQPPAVP